MDEETAIRLVMEAMDNEYVDDPRSYDPKSRGQVFLDGCFHGEVLEAMAWCIKNDKWPKRP